MERFGEKRSRSVPYEEKHPEHAEVLKEDFLGKKVKERTRGPEFEKILKEIDFAFMERILHKIAVKSGIDPKQTSFVSPENIYEAAESDRYAAIYYPLPNVIFVNFRMLVRQASREQLILPSVVTKVVLHEEIHASAHNSCGGISPLQQSGYAKRGLLGDRYESLNEGVVELLCQKLIDVHGNHFGVNREEGRYRSYDTTVLLVNLLIKGISGAFGVSDETARDALVCGLYEGFDFDDRPLRKSLQKSMPPSYLEVLARKTPDEIRASLREILLKGSEERNSPIQLPISWVGKLRSLLAKKG